MDVLRPPVVWINGICYRKNLPGASSSVFGGGEEDVYNDEGEFEAAPYGDETCDAFSAGLEETDSGWRLPLSVPSAYYKFIIGKKGETKKRIESETRTQIRIPRQGQEGEIVIVGRDRKGVLSARSRVDILVESAREKLPFTHFLSLPVSAPHIQAAFLDFKEQVLDSCDADRGVDETIFQNPLKLHLTLGTLVLLSEREVAAAADLLRQCAEDVVRPALEGRPLEVDVKGLEYMNDDPNAVDVLYAKVAPQDGSDRLQTLADGLVTRFARAGLMCREYERVKLHVTVMNTLMRRDPSGAAAPAAAPAAARGGRYASKERESFDASNVLRIYGQFAFGQLNMEEVHLSERYSADPATGYYAAPARLQLL